MATSARAPTGPCHRSRPRCQGRRATSFPVELLEAPGRGWRYSGGGYSLLQLLIEELTGRPFADYMQAQVLEPLGMTASSFRWSRTAQTARPHDTDGGPIPDFAFAEQAAAGLVTTAPDLARFLAAALAGPRGEPPGRGVLSPAGVRLALTAAPATDGRWGLGYGLGLTPSGDRLAYHEGANRGWRAGLALLPDRRAGIVAAGQQRRRQRPDRRRGPAVAGPRHAEPEARTASHRGARHPDRRGRRRDRAGQETPNTEEACRPPEILSGTVASGDHSNRRPPPESLNAA